VLLFTNDGEFSHRLTHPSYGIKRVYHARVKGQVIEDELAQLSMGVELPDGYVARAEARLKGIGTGYSLLELTLTEGRKREVKHLCKAIDHPVMKLVRVNFGGITCDGLKPGQWRYLRANEIETLRKMVKMDK
jgi:pseudouridine synthase